MSELDALWQAVYDARDDDAPRRVLADRLQELGDPRGEFINLQLARQATGARATSREKELLRRHQRDWAPRRLVIYKGRVWKGGLLWRASLAKGRGLRMPDVLPREWPVIEELDMACAPWVGETRALLERDETRPRALWGVQAQESEALAGRPGLRRVGLILVDPHIPLARSLAGLDLLHLSSWEPDTLVGAGVEYLLNQRVLTEVGHLVLQVEGPGLALEALRDSGRTSAITIERHGQAPPATHTGWALDCEWLDGWHITARPGRVRTASDYELAMMLERQLVPAGCRWLQVVCDQPTSMLAQGSWGAVRMTAQQLGIELGPMPDDPRRGE